ncbi:MAG: hypothetical protein ACI9CF_000903 [Candidatus Omnitrophota bacterium]|jgi:hypothetical protein
MKKFNLINTFILVGTLILTTSLLASESNFAKPSQKKIQSVYQLLDEAKVLDARYPSLKGYESLVFSYGLRERLEESRQLNTLELQKQSFISILKEASRIGEEVIEMEWKHLPFDQQQAYQALHDRKTKYELDELIDVVGSKTSVKSLNQYIGYTQSRIRSHQKGETGETGRKILSLFAKPFIEGWKAYHILTDNRLAQEVNFDKVTLYQPPDKQNTPLELYAPTIIVEKPHNPTYEASIDQIGEVHLTGNDLADATPTVNIHKPTVYSYVEQKKISGIELTQLVYVIWFPEHPPVHGVNDPEAGILEGWTLRITLNRDQEPILFESVSNCGCYYKVFPSANLEEVAKQIFIQPLEGKIFVLENAVPNKIDATMPELIHFEAGQSGRVALSYEAGTHQLMSIIPVEQSANNYNSKETQAYRLAAYDELEQLDYHGHKASLFEPSGLVRKAHREECGLLSPTGMYHAGHPRQRTTQLIYFDQFEFDDNDLFETYLRLPKEAL